MKFHYTIIGLVLLDLLIVFIELILSLLSLPCYTEEQKLYFSEHGLMDLPVPTNCKLPESHGTETADWFLWALSTTLLTIFVVELFAAGIAFGFITRYKKPIYMIDAIVVLSSFVSEIYFKFGKASLRAAPSTLIALRMSKIIRAVHAITHSIVVKSHAIISRVRTAKAILETSYHNLSSMFEQQERKISYLRSKATQVTDMELDEYVEKGRRERDGSGDLKETRSELKMEYNLVEQQFSI